MSQMITGSMDVTLIEKGKLVAGKKKRDDGKVGQYLNFVLIPTPGGQFGDFMVKQELSKEEREAGKKGAILGNAKFLKKKETEQKAESHEPDNTPW